MRPVTFSPAQKQAQPCFIWPRTRAITAMSLPLRPQARRAIRVCLSHCSRVLGADARASGRWWHSRGCSWSAAAGSGAVSWGEPHPTMAVPPLSPPGCTAIPRFLANMGLAQYGFRWPRAKRKEHRHEYIHKPRCARAIAPYSVKLNYLHKRGTSVERLVWAPQPAVACLDPFTRAVVRNAVIVYTKQESNATKESRNGGCLVSTEHG